MSRRCKPGQRARVIGAVRNRGKIVLVVRHYFYDEKISDATWPQAIYPWVVTSLGAPLRWRRIDGSAEGAAMTVVVDDCNLEPLDDDDDGIVRSTDVGKPTAKPRKPVFAVD